VDILPGTEIQASNWAPKCAMIPLGWCDDIDRNENRAVLAMTHLEGTK
jgi:hypothetical protein